MKLPLFWVDAFARRPFEGNPAAVCPLDAWLPDATLQSLAFEHGLSETAFFVRTGPARYHLRWFTPEAEVALCGHATLASAHVLYACLGYNAPELTFDSRSGPLVVARRGERLELDFPARPALPGPVDPRVRQAVGGPEPEAVAVAGNSTLLIYGSRGEVAALTPDFAALRRLGDLRVIPTAPGGDCDFVSRFFAAGVGVDEDPVTGSAHCTLVPYWAARLGRRQLHARQISRRGGELWCTDAGERVKIAGQAVLYLQGEIHL